MSSLPPECQQFLVSGYVLGNLSPAEAALFAEMLAENPSLIEQVREMQQALDLTYNPPEVPPPAGLRDRILASANAQKANTTNTATPTPATTADTATNTSSTSTAVSSDNPIKSKLALILGAIALSTITLLGINNYRLWRMVKTADIVQTDSRTYLLQGESSEAQVKLIVDADRLEATLIAKNLPPQPLDKVYALWTVVGKDVPYTTDQKGAILTAVFQVDESGNFEREIALPQPHLEPKTIKKMAITVEDIAAPQAHEGSIFIDTP